MAKGDIMYDLDQAAMNYTREMPRFLRTEYVSRQIAKVLRPTDLLEAAADAGQESFVQKLMRSAPIFDR